MKFNIKQYRYIWYILWICCMIGTSFATPTSIATTFKNTFSPTELANNQFEIMHIYIANQLSSKHINKENDTTKTIIKEYCTTLKNLTEQTENTIQYKKNDHQIYDLRYSVFTYFLCNSVTEETNFFSQKLLDNYLKKTNIERLGIWFGWDSTCERTSITLNTCPIYKVYPALLQKILNEYVNIKQTQFFGTQKGGETTTEKANNFSKKYFNTLEICKDDLYPKTCKVVKRFIKSTQNMKNHIHILDMKKLMKSKSVCNKDAKDYDILYCGLLWDTTTPDLAFNNLLYNEIYRYNLFLEYYSYYVAKDPKIFLSWANSVTYKNPNIIQERVRAFRKKSDILIQGIRNTIYQLQEIKTTFPLHVWLLMYQEDLIRIRKAFWQSYAPIRTLSDKLRNVQDTNG